MAALLGILACCQGFFLLPPELQQTNTAVFTFFVPPFHAEDFAGKRVSK
jgi:hypothetical protein